MRRTVLGPYPSRRPQVRGLQLPVDLREAAAREAAKKSGAATKRPKQRTTTVVRRDGREPLRRGDPRGQTAPALVPHG
ncbi:hypothetical protein [Streptomyces microflavus]|uniref:hypothetical protein n=1 Tax=Streptomyces microflavus TaxID=1919 RepID=UPI00365F7651